MVKTIAVVGRDGDAWLAALILQLSLGKAEPPVDVTLVELPSTTAPQDIYATLPTQRALHDLLGLPELNVLSVSGGVQSLGYRYSGWTAENSAFFHVYDTAGAEFDGVDFIQYWTKARQRGLDVALDEFSLAAAAARRGKMIILNDQGAGFSRASHGYNLSALAYLKGVAKVAIEAGVRHVVAEIESIPVTDGRIETVQLRDGQRIQADLFIDASGSGELIAQLEGGEFESWERWFACDRAVVASAPRLRPMASFNQISAFDSGWLGLYPLASRTGLLAPFCSDYSSADEVLQSMAGLAGMQIEQPLLKTLNTGMRSQPWVANCVAVGSSAALMDPVQGVQLHVLHTSLSYLLTLLPLDHDSRPEREMYNTRLVDHIERLRDFQLAHYVLNGRARDPFWCACSGVQVPNALEEKIDLFKARGRVAMWESEAFQEESWHALFTGSGLVPAEYDPLVDKMAEEHQIKLFQSMLKFVAEQAEQMPDMETSIEIQDANHFDGAMF